MSTEERHQISMILEQWENCALTPREMHDKIAAIVRPVTRKE